MNKKIRVLKDSDHSPEYLRGELNIKSMDELSCWGTSELIEEVLKLRKEVKRLKTLLSKTKKPNENI